MVELKAEKDQKAKPIRPKLMLSAETVVAGGVLIPTGAQA